MEQVDTTIIGAGAVGLAIAHELSNTGQNIVAVERNDSFGKETSSRNSEVVHGGIYYPEGSLKASLCVEGRKLVYEICRREGIPFRKTGKIIVAPTPSRIPDLERLKKRGDANGVENLRMLDKRELAVLEPDVRAEAGLLSPETGIFDTHGFMAYLERKASNSVTFAYRCEVDGIDRKGDGYVISIKDADGERYRLKSRTVINAAGLGAERIAQMAGIDTVEARYTIYPCKGEYFRLRPGKGKSLSHLIYPPPTDTSLRTHTVLDLQGGIKLGPNAFYVDAIDYSVDEAHRRDFYLGVKDFLPFIEEEDLTPDMAGIRPKLYRTGEPMRDFAIREEADRGLPGFINLIGIESPGLTASPAIGSYVARLLHLGSNL
jgi:L-2-hydroxyglutarate oxidase LhgO